MLNSRTSCWGKPPHLNQVGWSRETFKTRRAKRRKGKHRKPFLDVWLIGDCWRCTPALEPEKYHLNYTVTSTSGFSQTLRTKYEGWKGLFSKLFWRLSRLFFSFLLCEDLNWLRWQFFVIWYVQVHPYKTVKEKILHPSVFSVFFFPTKCFPRTLSPLILCNMLFSLCYFT